MRTRRQAVTIDVRSGAGRGARYSAVLLAVPVGQFCAVGAAGDRSYRY